jgi:endonuclease/exonuclease/phosphatase family metal-dependent hydrolase
MGCGYGHAYGSTHDDAWRYLLGITDVALVQEAVPPDWLDADDYVFEPKYPDQSWGTAVVARGLRPRRVQTGDEQRWLPKMPGAAVIADIDINGRPTRFVSMHPRAEATDEGFTGDADLTGIKPAYHSRAFPVDLVHSDLTPLLREHSFVAAGDLNSALRFDFVRGRNSEVFGNADLFQKFRDHGWRDGHLKFHAGEERTFFRGDQNYMLDHLYVDDALYAALRSCDVLAYDEVSQYSDHAPLAATIDL